MGTRYKGTKNEVLALNSFIKLMRATESVSGRVHQHLTNIGLTVSQFGTLEALYHIGPMSQADIGKKILKSSGNITMVIDHLEKRGLVKRIRSQEDRRFFTIHLTEEGNRLIHDFFPTHATLITKEMSVLSSSEQKDLARLCRKLGTGRETNR